MNRALSPLVTIICTAYKHEKYIGDCLTSVANQTYPNIEVIIIDNASQDNTGVIVESFVEKYSNWSFYPQKKNLGLCKAFNFGFRKSKGAYFIDLSADDILLPTRVEDQVKEFLTLDNSYGVVFSDVEEVDENDVFIRTHHKRDKEGKLLFPVKDGDIYKELIASYYLSTPSIMIKREVLEKLGGYDENLSYEDYDFFARSSRMYKYKFIDKILTKKRILSSSLSRQFYIKKTPHLASTLMVCYKIAKMNQTKLETESLIVSIRYHMRQSLYFSDNESFNGYYELLKKLNYNSLCDDFLNRFSFLNINITFLYRFYLCFFKKTS